MNSPNPPAASLDSARLGEALLKLVPTAILLGHTTVAETLRDYVHPGSEDPEVAFLCDMFTCSTSELAERWFGGELAASAVAAHVIGDILTAEMRLLETENE